MALKPQPQATSNILKGNPNNWVQAWAEYWASLDLTVRKDDATLAGLVTTVAGLGGGGVQGSFKNLSIKVASTTTVTVAADFVVVSDGTNFRQVAISATCNLGISGAVNALDAGSIAIDTWYFIWAIAKAGGATPGTLASLSATAPTLPAGYTMKARIGAVQTIHATPTLYGSWQFGNRAQYVVGLASTTVLPIIQTGVTGTYSATTPTWTSFTVVGNGNFVPTTASHIKLICSANFKNASVSEMQIAPSNAYGGYANVSGLVPPFDSVLGTMQGPVCFEFMLESNNIFATSTAAGSGVQCLGWIDNI